MRKWHKNFLLMSIIFLANCRSYYLNVDKLKLEEHPDVAGIYEFDGGLTSAILKLNNDSTYEEHHRYCSGHCSHYGHYSLKSSEIILLPDSTKCGDWSFDDNMNSVEKEKLNALRRNKTEYLYFEKKLFTKMGDKKYSKSFFYKKQ
jgi:hypothetical protein